MQVSKTIPLLHFQRVKQCRFELSSMKSNVNLNFLKTLSIAQFARTFFGDDVCTSLMQTAVNIQCEEMPFLKKQSRKNVFTIHAPEAFGVKRCSFKRISGPSH